MTNSNERTAKEILTDWANQHGITPASFKEATGYSYQHCWNLLRGSYKPTRDTVARILDAYGASVAEPISIALNRVSHGE